MGARGMRASPHPRLLGLTQRMMVVDPEGQRVADSVVGGLRDFLRRGDVVVLNDAATLPAAIPVTSAAGRPHELRLVAALAAQHWRAVVMGPGDWRDDTDARPPPDRLNAGDELRATSGLVRIRGVDSTASRLVVVELVPPRGVSVLEWLYAVARPIQYSYTDRPLDTRDVQGPFAARPWAIEMPSAGRPLRVSLVLALRAAGVGVHRLTHAAGLSATGDPTLDARLPMPERYEIPTETALAVRRANRVIAVGTSVVRALEGSFAERGDVLPGRAETELVIGDGFRPRVVSGLLSGVHEPDTSHHDLLAAFASPETLALADRHAATKGYCIHEFGDSTLILPGSLRPSGLARSA